MNNNFTSKTRELFDQWGYADRWECWLNNADCLQHILWRVSNSPYNAAPLNNFECHQPEGRKWLLAIHSEEQQKKYLIKTKDYLDDIGYKPNKKDLEFLDKYKKLYA